MALNPHQSSRAASLSSVSAKKRFPAHVIGLRPTERLFIEKTLLKMYPRLQKQDLFPWNLLHGPLIPDFLVKNTSLQTRRIVVIGCGDGILCNILSLLFPTIEIVGIDPSPEAIAAARATVGHRYNLKFICGNAANLLEIPCDRIIYDRCLLKLGDETAFRKLLVKTIDWLVDGGDFIVREAPIQLLKHPRLLKAMWPAMRHYRRLEAGIGHFLWELGYTQPKTYPCKRFSGLVTEVYHHCAKNPGLDAPGNPPDDTVQEWQDMGDQSTNSVLGFLFAQSSSDFNRVWD